MRRSNRRFAGPLWLLAPVALGAVCVSPAFAQDAVSAPEAPITHDPQVMDPMGWQGKLRFHVVSAYGPAALAGAVAYDGFLQGIGFPREWGQGGLGYSKRLGSTLAYSGVRNLLGFGLDSALHQDPRY